MTWLYIPSAFVLASAESNEDLNLRHLERLSQSCTASGKSAQPRSLRTRLREEAYQPLRSGLTLRPSQAAQLLDTWIESESIASRAATHANRSQPLANDLAKTMRGIYGLPSLKRLSDMHQRCVSSRMSEGILFSDFEKSANVWSDWVTGLRQACSQRLKLVQDTDASDCSSWPTAVANDDNKSSEAHMAMKARMKGGPRHKATSLQVVAKMWATPQAFDSTDIKKDPNGTRLKRGGCRTLADDISHRFPQDQTPTGVKSSNDGQSSPQQWASPNAANATGTRNRTAKRSVQGKHNDGETLCDQVYPKRLNPTFVAWLMGYLEPINCGPMETRSSRIVQQWLSSVCGQHYEEVTDE